MALSVVSQMYVQAATNEVPSAQKPVNVIYILVDDLGIGDLGCYGQRRIKTPNIDALAANGMRFTQHYSGSTVSAPSRCSLITGKHTGHAYVRGNNGYQDTDNRWYDTNLKASETTVADIFKKKGYATACVGKWGLGGPNAEGHPNRHGFDYFFGYLGQGNAHFYFPDQLFENERPVVLNHKSYTPDLMLDHALDFLETQLSGDNTKPFFLYYTPTIPHAELVLPKGEDNPYDGKFFETPYIGKHYCSQPKPRATYAGMVSRLDTGVGKIMKLLKEKEATKNTIVIFTSDNGTHKEGGHDPNFFDSNGPFRGYKRDLYEGGIRTPFIVQWDGVVKKGTASDLVGAFWDFMPTVCDLLDVPVPTACDGLSYLPTLTGQGEQMLHSDLYFEFHEQGGKQAIIQGPWKLIVLNVKKPKKKRVELYNIMTDPGELCNVAKQYPNRVKDLKELINQRHTPSEIWKFPTDL